jgi:polar amino acid transport system substrate-binding protein
LKKLTKFCKAAAFVGAAAFLGFSVMCQSSLAATLKEQVASDGKIAAAVWGAWPYGVATSDGKTEGIYPDVWKAMAAPLGVKDTSFQVLDFGALIPSLMSHRIDVVAGGIIITPARCKQVAFSNPVGGAQGNSAVVKAGNPFKIHGYDDMAKNPAIRVGDIRGAASVEILEQAGIPKDRTLLFPDKTSAVAALFANRIDVLIYDTGTAVSIIKDPNVKGLERATPFKEIVNGKEIKRYWAFAFRPEDASFRDAVNQNIAKLEADGTIAKIFQKYGFSKEEAAASGVSAKDICGTDYK